MHTHIHAHPLTPSKILPLTGHSLLTLVMNTKAQLPQLQRSCILLFFCSCSMNQSTRSISFCQSIRVPMIIQYQDKTSQHAPFRFEHSFFFSEISVNGNAENVQEKNVTRSFQYINGPEKNESVGGGWVDEWKQSIRKKPTNLSINFLTPLTCCLRDMPSETKPQKTWLNSPAGNLYSSQRVANMKARLRELTMWKLTMLAACLKNRSTHRNASLFFQHGGLHN